MIAQLVGEITFSDGVELILLTNSGVGHQVYFNEILPEGTEVNLYISHIIRENGEQLFGFKSLRGKKLFEIRDNEFPDFRVQIQHLKKGTC